MLPRSASMLPISDNATPLDVALKAESCFVDMERVVRSVVGVGVIPASRPKRAVNGSLYIDQDGVVRYFWEGKWRKLKFEQD